MTEDSAKSTKPTVLMKALGALAGAVLGSLLAVSVLHFVKLGCLATLSGERYICSMLTWVYIGWPVLAVSVLAGAVRGMLIQSRPEYTRWTRLVRWAVLGWVIGLGGQVAVMMVVAVADLNRGPATGGLVVEEVRLDAPPEEVRLDAPPPVERGRSAVDFVLATALALPALGAFGGTYGGWRRWKRIAEEEAV